MIERLIQAVEKYRIEILNAERYIWNHPETGFKEWKTSAYLTQAFEGLGYVLVQAENIPGFYADFDTGRPGPTICIMGEMDSLICFEHPECDPATGAVHACGHNAQCAALLGVALALKEPEVSKALCGRIRLMAVPAEELIELEYRQSLRKAGSIHYLGGKVEFLYRGYFDGVDMAFMIHTGGHETGLVIESGCNGCVVKTAQFEGLSTHASSPSHAVNALYAANLALNAINALRETFDDKEHTRVHPIITCGGTAVNAIPGMVNLESYVRGASLQGISRENKKVNRALAASAAAMGAKVHLIDSPGYCPLHNDPILSEKMREAYTLVTGSENAVKKGGWGYGCTDMGDLSAVLPVVHPYISGSSGQAHGKDYVISDPESACVVSAKVQLVVLWWLLRDNGKEAQLVKANARPFYPDFPSYFAAVDALRLDEDLVKYTDQGILLSV